MNWALFLVLVGSFGIHLLTAIWIDDLRGRLGRLETRYEAAREKHFRTTGITLP